MKRMQVILAVGLLMGLLVSTAGAFADPSVAQVEMARPSRTPGARATERAVERAAEDQGKPEKTPGAKATDKAIERASAEQGKAGGKKMTFTGTVVTASLTSLTLNLGSGGTMTFTVTPATVVKIPTMGAGATAADLNPGVRVLVQAKDENGLLTALRIHVSPGKPQKIHRVGVVIAYTEGLSITIEAKGGVYSFTLTADTKILPWNRADELAVGRRVTITSRRDVTGGSLTAQGVVVHPLPEEEGTPTATNTPGPSPTATNTPTPTATATPTNTPTSTPTPTDTPTATSTSTPTDTPTP